MLCICVCENSLKRIKALFSLQINYSLFILIYLNHFLPVYVIFHQLSISVFMPVFQNWCSHVSKPQSLVLFGARSDQVWKQWSAKLLANASKLV